MRRARLLDGYGLVFRQSPFFSDTTFAPGTFSSQAITTAIGSNARWSVSSDRVSGLEEHAPNDFVLQQFLFERTATDTFNSIFAPVFLHEFTWDPSTQGAVIEAAASIRPT